MTGFTRTALFFFMGLLCNAGDAAFSAEEPSYQPETMAADLEVPATANRQYQLFKPAAGDADSAKKWPLLIYMHGGGSKGDDGQKPIREELARIMGTAELQAKFPCFVLVPQCKAGDDATGERPNNWVKWNNQRKKPFMWTLSDDAPSDQLLGAMAALQDVLKKFPIDETRIYLTGVSMGGSASWNWASRDPKRFAAMIPVCGLSDARRAPMMADVKVWTFHGARDEEVPVERTRMMVKALKEHKSPVIYTEYEDGGHGIAKRVWSENDHAALRWLFEQQKE